MQCWWVFSIFVPTLFNMEMGQTRLSPNHSKQTSIRLYKSRDLDLSLLISHSVITSVLADVAKYHILLPILLTFRYKQEWRSAGIDKQYNSLADVFGSAGGDCLDQYKYKTYGTSRECNVPWYYHK